jgi:tetratricopeptide (TPR) repeat protein
MRRPSQHPRLLLLCGLGCAVLCNTAQAWDAPAEQPARSKFWGELAAPGVRRAQSLASQAKAHEREARQASPVDWENVCKHAHTLPLSSDSPEAREGRRRAVIELARRALLRRAELDAAIARLERARQLRPDDAELAVTLGRVLALWEEPGPLEGCTVGRKSEQALAALREARRIDPQFMADRIAFEEGILLTRERRFAEAAEAYARAIALSLDPRDTAVIRANLAEVTMLAGSVEAALAHYTRAMELSTGGRDYLLALWGLGVALDRLGEHEAALERIALALRSDGGQMRVLRSDSVFFEPAHELLYYEALGHEAGALDSAGGRADALAAAVQSWQAYLAAASPDERWRDGAEQNLERVREQLARLARKPGRRGAAQREKTRAETFP